MPDEPPEFGRVELLLHAMVERGLSLAILEVHVGTAEREDPGGPELLPPPRREERRYPYHDVDFRAGGEQQFHVLDVVPPSGREQSAARSCVDICASFQEKPDERRVPRTCHRKEQGCAGILEIGRASCRES